MNLKSQIYSCLKTERVFTEGVGFNVNGWILTP